MKAVDLRHQKGGQIRLFHGIHHVANVLAARPECAETADLIVRAVNSHDELLAALKELSRAVADAGKEGTAGNLARAEAQAQTAIAKAEGTT